MAPFSLRDPSIKWPTQQLVDLVRQFDVVLGTSSYYEAYLFCLVDKQIAKYGILGAGCNEKEVEDLVASAERPVLLLLSDSLSKDTGIGLLGRLRGQRQEIRTILIINSLDAYMRNQDALSSFDGLVSATSIGRGGILSCLEAICQGGHYIDKILENIANENSHTVWNELNQREREILPLLARGLKNKEIAAELFIAETTTRDYVSVILAKLQVSNRAAAAAWAIEHGLAGI
jgi:DNA-binding NarL/FixJ family response regulator